MGKYYDMIMEPIDNSFSTSFNKCWGELLDSFPAPYANAIQLRIGNQLRPKLTCWGAAFNTDSCDEIDFAQVAEVASYIEMLHKASIIVDDMVDNDDARHGKQAFHIEFGTDKALIFVLALLGRGSGGINRIFQNSKLHFRGVELYTDTIYKMAIGCLKELNLNTSSQFDVNKIRDIINLETISLIKNSLLLGYWSNFAPAGEIEESIVKIGENCGYIFQILNDLEPFSSARRNQHYKGGWNLDVERNRKNIAVAYIFGAATRRERQALHELNGLELQNLLMELYEKYSVQMEVCEEARAIDDQTKRLIRDFYQVSKHTACLSDFSMFVDEMVQICFSKLGE